jgi:hypothetical protein
MTLVILNLLGFVGTIVVNTLANALPINNKNTGELSDAHPNLFVPAGITFSIWGIIYLLLTIFVIYQIVYAIKNKTEENTFIDKIGMLFFISSLANISWIFSWHYQLLPLSLVIMVVLLISLINIYLQLNIGKQNLIRKENKLVHITFSVYLGWISIATIANITAYLVNMGWNRFGLSEEFWTVIVLIVGIALSLIMLFKRRDIYYCLVVLWAFTGILIKRTTADPVSHSGIIITVIAGLTIISVASITQLIRRKIY